MLLGLRHYAVVGGDGEEDEIHAVRAREHVADEALVAGHVDDARALAAQRVEVREAEVDRDAALLLLLETVRVLSRECPHERGLPVVDVARGADDDGHPRSVGEVDGELDRVRDRAQVEQEAPVVDAADDGRRRRPEARRDALRRELRMVDRERAALERGRRRRAAPHLALGRDDLDPVAVAETRPDDRRRGARHGLHQRSVGSAAARSGLWR